MFLLYLEKMEDPLFGEDEELETLECKCLAAFSSNIVDLCAS